MRCWIAALSLALAVCGCAQDRAMSSIRSDLRADRVDDAVRKVDALAATTPNNYDVQIALATAHHRAAIRCGNEHDEAGYVSHVETAFAAYTRASNLDPRRGAPHEGVAALLLYQGDMKGALEELQIARMIEPLDPTHTANLAQMYVYMGRLSRARALIEQARKAGLHPVFAETVEMLASWREGDLVDARDLFELAYQEPKAMRDFLQDPSSKAEFTSFDEMTRYCCGAASCGPHMGDACERMHHEVKQREVAAETLRRERQAALEREKARREVFGGAKQIEIEAEKADSDEGGGDEAP